MTLIEHFLNQGGTTDKAKITFRVGAGECERGELPVFFPGIVQVVLAI